MTIKLFVYIVNNMGHIICVGYNEERPEISSQKSGVRKDSTMPAKKYFRINQSQIIIRCVLIYSTLFFLYGNSGAQIPVSERHCRIGLAYVTANRQVMTIDTAYQRISEAADVAYIQGSWPEWESGMFDNDIQIARKKGLRIYLALDFLGYTPVARATMKLPPSLGGDTATFSTPGVSQAYINFVKQLIQKYTPDYFVPMVEINLHKTHRPDSYNKFVQLYPQLYSDIKTLSPATLSGPSITYNDIASPSGFGPEDKAAFKVSLADFEANSDINAVSIYPFNSFPSPTTNPLIFDFHPEAIPDTFLSELASFSKNPLFISENSWISHGFSVPLGTLSLAFNATPQDQKNYIYRMAQLANIAYTRGKRITAINFVSLIDPTPAVTALIIQTSPQLEWFCYLGLFDGTGAEKPAFAALKEWKQISNSSISYFRQMKNNPMKLFSSNSVMTIQGLQKNTAVSIFAPDGKLIRNFYSGTSGRITWDYSDVRGEKVSKGTFLLFQKNAPAYSLMLHVL
jgi:hypothetical protein